MNEFLKETIEAIDEKQGLDIRILDIGKISTLADYFVIAHGNNTPQIEAIVDNIDFKLSKKGYKPLEVEGEKKAGWILMDYGHTIVHIFGQKERAFYDLERLWAEADPILLEDENILK